MKTQGNYAMLSGAELVEGMKALVVLMSKMIEAYGSADITFTDPDGKTCATASITDIRHFPIVFKDGAVKEMLTKHGGISLIEPNMNNGTVRIGYLERGTLAKMEGATLQ